MHVHEKRAAGDNFRLTLASRQQPPGRPLRSRAHCPDRSNGRRARQDTTHRGNDSGTSLVANGERRRRLARQNPDADRLKLELTHRTDLSDAGSVNQR